MLWSIDIDPEDWRPLSPDEVVERILSRLEKRHSGIVLMHDVQPHTAAAVPKLLVALKSHGYSIVHVMAGKAEASAGTIDLAPFVPIKDARRGAVVRNLCAMASLHFDWIVQCMR